MVYFVQRHLARIDEYRRFAQAMSEFLHAEKAAAPALKSFIESLEEVVQQIPQEYEVQKENMKSLEHAADLTGQTMALTENHTTNNLSAYMELLKAWRGMGGAQDYIVAQCHTLTRKLFQEASSSATTHPKALELALEIRKRCRDILRNADGYEIWPNY